MTWIEVSAELPTTPDPSPFIELFRTYGIENTLEKDGRLIGAMVDVPSAAEAINALCRALLDAGAPDVETRELPEENWEEAWKQHFKPRRIGRQFVVRPTWEPFAKLPGDLEIVLDPGQAFGTGDHPTTRQCLALMEDAGIAGRRVADIGCGSGILSIAAALLGAREVVAIDVEPVAVEVAAENVRLNGVACDIRLGEGMPDDGPFDVVISNIISAILIRIARTVLDGIQPGGRWIVSGIIEQNWPDVHQSALRSGFVLDEERREDGWVAAVFHRGQTAGT